MATAVFPKILQDNPNVDYSETMIDGVIRSNPDMGPTISRPRFTKTRITSKLSIWVDKEQYEAFMNFYNIDLVQGVYPFTWKKPITETPVTFKFKAPPAISYVGPLTWTISCELEEV